MPNSSIPRSSAGWAESVGAQQQFVGPTICYAFMQAVGLVNDHMVGCYRYQQVNAMGKK
jgi:3-methyladenine DNA glycosylase Tag